jgi:hypothetical protein
MINVDWRTSGHAKMAVQPAPDISWCRYPGHEPTISWRSKTCFLIEGFSPAFPPHSSGATSGGIPVIDESPWRHLLGENDGLRGIMIEPVPVDTGISRRHRRGFCNSNCRASPPPQDNPSTSTGDGR